MKVCVSQVFFLFSSTKIGHDRPSVKDRYAISDKNILRSCVVRYFYLKFLACRSPMPWEMYKKKGKKWGGRCVEAVSPRMKHLLALCPNGSSLSVRIRYLFSSDYRNGLLVRSAAVRCGVPVFYD